MQKRLSIVIHGKTAPKFSNFLCRIKCIFGKHQMLPMGEVRMYGQRSFVLECPHCELTRWGAWSQRIYFGSHRDWQMRSGRVRKSVIGREIKLKEDVYGIRTIKSLARKVSQGS